MTAWNTKAKLPREAEHIVAITGMGEIVIGFFYREMSYEIAKRARPILSCGNGVAWEWRRFRVWANYKNLRSVALKEAKEKFLRDEEARTRLDKPNDSATNDVTELH